MITATSKEGFYLTEVTNGTAAVWADAAANEGGGGAYQRPGELLASGYAACVNITTRKTLDEMGLAYERVTVRVEMDRSNPEKLVFRTHTDIEGEIPEETKAQVIERVKNCPVCRLLQMEKEFLPLV